MRANLASMRSMNTQPSAGARDAGDTPAQHFGSLVHELASRAGYDLSLRGSGPTALAADTGMSRSAVVRMLEGKTLPMPDRFEALATALGVTVQYLLIEAGIISPTAWPRHAGSGTSSTTPPPHLSPEAAADAWGITDPTIRKMLIHNVEQAIRLQHEKDGGLAAETGARVP